MSGRGTLRGRTILALILLAQATHREPRYLSEILAELPARFNEKGYLGRILPDGIQDEQQLFGHLWILRALCEYYLWKKDEKVLDIVKRIVANLYLSAAEDFATYPAEPEKRIVDGRPCGHLTGDVIDNWYTSSDIGIGFAALDGITQAYAVLGDPELKKAIDKIIAKFVTIDYVNSSFQTHSTLSSLRGILRHYESTGDAKLLDIVKRIYATYMSEAITENYANYNWFLRPEWTEPCAVIDSFILAVGLWRNTQDRKYLDDAHNIFFNAMRRGQRSNGGWGIDTCVGARDEFMRLRGYEATWCCTMRGGEGLAKAIQYLCFMDGETVILPFYADSVMRLRFDDGNVVLRQNTGYPVNGTVRLEVIGSTTSAPKTIRMFIPDWVNHESISLKVDGTEMQGSVENGFITVTTPFVRDTRIELLFDIGLRCQETINKSSIQGYHTFRHGALILGIKNDGDPISIPSGSIVHLTGARYAIEGNDYVLSPIDDVIKMSEDEAKIDCRQILFSSR